MTLIDVAPKILTSFDSELSNYATQRFSRKGIHVRTNTLVAEVKQDGLILKSGEFVATRCIIWATGLSPNPLIKSLDLELDLGKRLITDEWLQLLGKDGKPLPGVFALGDCATIKGTPLPQTAQVGNQIEINHK